MEDSKWIINSKQVANMIGNMEHSKLKRDIEKYIFKTKSIVDFFKKINYSYKISNGGYKQITVYNMTLDGVKLILDSKRKTPKMQPLYNFYNEHSNENHKVVLSSRFEDEFFNKLKLTLEAMDIEIELQKQVSVGNNNYRLDGYLPKYNLVIEYDEKQHRFSKEEDLKREKNIKSILNCDFIRLNYEENDNYNIGLIMKKMMEI